MAGPRGSTEDQHSHGRLQRKRQRNKNPSAPKKYLEAKRNPNQQFPKPHKKS